jgi:hypothetical protein
MKLITFSSSFFGADNRYQSVLAVVFWGLAKANFPKTPK